MSLSTANRGSNKRIHGISKPSTFFYMRQRRTPGFAGRDFRRRPVPTNGRMGSSVKRLPCGDQFGRQLRTQHVSLRQHLDSRVRRPDRSSQVGISGESRSQGNETVTDSTLRQRSFRTDRKRAVNVQSVNVQSVNVQSVKRYRSSPHIFSLSDGRSHAGYCQRDRKGARLYRQAFAVDSSLASFQ